MIEVNKKTLIEFIENSEEIELNVAISGPGDDVEEIHTAPLNDIVFCRKTGKLELWYNTGYEI